MTPIPKTGKKPRKPKLATLKKTLDAEFSHWVRRSNAKNGYISCVSCGVSKRWQEADAGHWISRVHLATRFHPLNVWPQCKRCNGFLGGNYPAYSLWMFDNVGITMMQDLQEMKNNPVKFTRAGYEEKIAEYRQKLTQLDERERRAA